jgi:hypothetical protein
LVLDVLLYDSPITTSPYCASVVPITPELTSPQVFLECWVRQEQLLGGDAFEDTYDLTNAVLRVKANQQVDVVLVITELFNCQIVSIFNTFHSLTHGGDNVRTQQRLTVLNWKDKVVMGVVGAVVALGDWHTISIAASEGNLRFPSDSLPKLNPRGRAAGENGDYSIYIKNMQCFVVWLYFRYNRGLCNG